MPEGDSPEMEMQASGSFVYCFVLCQLLPGLEFLSVP